MKTILYVTIVGIAFLFQVNTQAQSIPNNDFENWTPSGKPAPFNWEEPTDWISTNSLTEFTFAGVKKTTDAYVGSFACQLWSVNISGGWPSAICNGTPNLIGSPFSDPSIDIITGGTPISSKPNKLIGYYKFDNNDLTDSAYAIVILKKYNTTLNKVDTVGMGDFLFSEKSTFTKFEMTINDLMPTVTPDSIVIAFYSTDPKKPKAPNFPATGLIIDSLGLGFAPNSVKDLENANIEANLYPNPANDLLVIDWEGRETYEINVYNILGQSVKVVEGQGDVRLDVSKYPKGQYFIRMTNQNEIQVFTKSFIVD
jgi:hypothetical protein